MHQTVLLYLQRHVQLVNSPSLELQLILRLVLVLTVRSVPPSQRLEIVDRVLLALPATPQLVQVVTLLTYVRSALRVPIQLAAADRA